MRYQVGQSSGVLERMTPPTLRSLYLFWLMQVTQGEIDPCLLNDIIHAFAGMLQRATLNALELETLLKVHVMVGRLRSLAEHHRNPPTHRVVVRTLGHAERLFIRRSSVHGTPHRRQRIGGIALRCQSPLR